MSIGIEFHCSFITWTSALMIWTEVMAGRRVLNSRSFSYSLGKLLDQG